MPAIQRFYCIFLKNIYRNMTLDYICYLVKFQLLMIYSSKVIFKNAPFHVQVLITTHHNLPDIEVVFNFFRLLMCGFINFIVDCTNSRLFFVHTSTEGVKISLNNHLYQCRSLVVIFLSSKIKTY